MQRAAGLTGKNLAILAVVLAVLAASAQAAPLERVNNFRAAANIDLQPLVVVEDALAKQVANQIGDASLETGTARYAKLGGKVPISYASITETGRMPAESWVVLLDPRARELVIIDDYTVAIRLDPQAKWTEPIVFPGDKKIDISKSKAVQGVLLPGPTNDRFTASRKYGDSWSPTYTFRLLPESEPRHGYGGSLALSLVDLSEMEAKGISLATASSYRIGTEGGPSDEMQTKAWQQPSGTFKFSARMPDRLRSIFLRNVRNTNSQAEALIGRLDGLLFVRPTPPGQTGFSSAGMTPTGGRPGMVEMWSEHLLRRNGHPTIHELGHIVDQTGIDDYSKAKFLAVFRKSSRWKKCFPVYGGGCAPGDEIFADQFAYWALGETKTNSGYGDPPLISRTTFGRMLRDHWAYSSGAFESP